MLNNSILRAYDIRGIVGQTLSETDAYNIGRAFGKFIKRDVANPTICTGRDGRLSSPELEKALQAGLVNVGVEVISVGCGPTPMLYFATKFLKADAGIMVTGSHNPPSHNGFKMIKGYLPLYGEQILELGAVAGADWHKDITPANNITEKDIRAEYINHLFAAFRNGGKELKIAWDAGNGASGEAMAALTAKLPGTHILLNEKIDGTFPSHHPDPTVAENLEQIIEVVKSKECDLGVAFDGDGDRVGLIDDKGRIIWGDQIMALLAEDVLKQYPGSTIIADVKTSQMLFDIVAKLGGKPLMWKTGHSLIKHKMAELNAAFAGEMSGHIFFRDNNCFDDGLYAAIKLINIVSALNSKLSEKVDSFPVLVNTPEIRIDVDESRKFAVIEEIKRYLQNEKADVNDIDGVRVNTKDGWWLLRASNTQACLVARCESSSKEGLDKLQQQLDKCLSKAIAIAAGQILL